MVARLTHARLCGTDDPYEHRSPDEIMVELSEIRAKYSNQDNNFLFQDRTQELPLVGYNHGHDALVDASVTLALPNYNSFYVADDIPSGEPVDVFSVPLRLCVGDDLSGRRFGLRYALQAQNLRAPARG